MVKIKIEKFIENRYSLCSSLLIISVDGESFKVELISGGTVWFDEYMSEHIESGSWSILDMPKKFEHLEKEIEDVINKEIPWGCCGGCV